MWSPPGKDRCSTDCRNSAAGVNDSTPAWTISLVCLTTRYRSAGYLRPARSTGLHDPTEHITPWQDWRRQAAVGPEVPRASLDSRAAGVITSDDPVAPH